MRRGTTHTEETRAKMRGHAHVGSGRYVRTEYHKEVTRRGIKRRYEEGVKMGFQLRNYISLGERNTNWRGGITPINEKIRKSAEYKKWRVSVFERDAYTCVLCGCNSGDKHADHIKPFALFPDLRFDVDNGRTLCVPCHKDTETYGAKIKNYENKIQEGDTCTES